VLLVAEMVWLPFPLWFLLLMMYQGCTYQADYQVCVYDILLDKYRLDLAEFALLRRQFPL
jgi:hypothetical protein